MRVLDSSQFLLCLNVLIFVLVLCLGQPLNAAEPEYVRYQEPDLFSYDELVALAETEPLGDPLRSKLDVLTTTPFISNEAHYQGTKPHRPEIDQLGPSLRVVMWNIERGFTLDDVKLMFSDTDAFLEKVAAGERRTRVSRLLQEIEVLQSADVLIFQEVDWGMKRTNYRAVVREIGETLKMNWAFGVEFVEIDPINLGTEKFEQLEDEDERKRLVADIQVDKERLRALHGTAILSRYPIREAKLEPFSKQGYDWYQTEKDRTSRLEEGKRQVAETVFLQTISREVRRGGRTCLIVTLDVPDLPEKKLTVAAPHLENRAQPKARREQMNELLVLLRDVRNPVVITGDLNTTLGDTQPTSVKREVYRRVGSSEFWATRGVKYATGVGLIYDVTKGTVNFFKNQNDPTAKHVPIIGPNLEQKLFKNLEAFRFRDGTVFDFRGDQNRTINATKGTLANSNQRENKGFAITYQVNRTVGPIGKLKLDWIFVKSYLEKPRNPSGPYRFAPHFARTMAEVNYSLEPRLSDHNPISIDLPFSEPGRLVKRKKKSLFDKVF